MKTINLLTKGNNTICHIENNEKINYVIFIDIKDVVYKLCSNYREISITEKNINISNSKLKLKIENYKENTNVIMIPVIRKLQNEYRELKKKRLRKQKIKRVAALSSAVLISSGMIVNALSNTNSVDVLAEQEKNNQNIIINTVKKTEEQSNINFVEEKNNNLTCEENITNVNNIEISFDSRVDSDKYKITKAYYNDIITKISNEYGIDPRIMLAIATQESGIHNSNLRGPAIGLMQIERSVWVGENITAYNYAKGTNETLNITEDKLKDLEFNIRASCIILKDCLNKSNYNLPVAIQMYNFGYGNMKKIFKSSYGENINFEKICIDCDNSWLENRGDIKQGDNKYLEHVFSYIEDLENIQIKSGEEVFSYNLINKIKTL